MLHATLCEHRIILHAIFVLLSCCMLATCEVTAVAMVAVHEVAVVAMRGGHI
jgi:hypothetical protein